MSIIELTYLMCITNAVAEIFGIAELMQEIPEDKQLEGITVNNISKVIIRACDVINNTICEMKKGGEN